MSKEVKLLTSDRTAFYLTMFAVIVLFPNAFYMLYKIGGDMPIYGLRFAQAFIGGVYISGSIAYFTIKKDMKTAYAFAVFEMLISFFYYWNRLMFESGDFKMNWYIIPACLIAAFLPWSVKNYAKAAASEPEPKRRTSPIIKVK